MTIFHSIILGLVEGITEFLPVSSTGHLILANSLLHITESDFTKSFDIIIQLGAILAVIVLYWKKIWNWRMIKLLIVGFVPTGIIGLALYKVVKSYLLGNESIVLWSLLIGGIVLIVFELWHGKTGREERATVQDVQNISYTQAATVGLFQALAIIPGVSRSAATIIGGMSLGIARTTIVEFSFLLAVPTMLAASGLDLVKNASLFSMDQFAVLAIGFVVSFVVAWGAIKFLLDFVRKHTFIPFGIYRIAVAIVFWLAIVR
ncbi:MAG TPA: undecaprenyl-diphosphate phosphatase [Candidatus Paceibacterota bacterium]